jgi:hypothetical protein
VLPPPATSANGLHAHDQQQQQHARGSFSGLSGMFSHLSHLGSLNTGRSIDRHSMDRRSLGSLDTDGWATPQSGASRWVGGEPRRGSCAWLACARVVAGPP